MMEYEIRHRTVVCTKKMAMFTSVLCKVYAKSRPSLLFSYELWRNSIPVALPSPSSTTTINRDCENLVISTKEFFVAHFFLDILTSLFLKVDDLDHFLRTIWGCFFNWEDFTGQRPRLIVSTHPSKSLQNDT